MTVTTLMDRLSAALMDDDIHHSVISYNEHVDDSDPFDHRSPNDVNSSKNARCRKAFNFRQLLSLCEALPSVTECFFTFYLSMLPKMSAPLFVTLRYCVKTAKRLRFLADRTNVPLCYSVASVCLSVCLSLSVCDVILWLNSAS